MRRDIPTVTTGTRFEDAFRIMQECNCPAVPVLDQHEAPGRFAYTRERDRTDDDSIGDAETASRVRAVRHRVRVLRGFRLDNASTGGCSETACDRFSAVCYELMRIGIST